MDVPWDYYFYVKHAWGSRSINANIAFSWISPKKELNFLLELKMQVSLHPIRLGLWNFKLKLLSDQCCKQTSRTFKGSRDAPWQCSRRTAAPCIGSLPSPGFKYISNNLSRTCIPQIWEQRTPLTQISVSFAPWAKWKRNNIPVQMRQIHAQSHTPSFWTCSFKLPEKEYRS